MANMFLKMGTRVGSIKQFIESTEASTGLKYRGGVDVNHLVYFPYTDVQLEDGSTERELVAIQVGVHDWVTPDGKYHNTVCTNGVPVTDENGNVIYDGTCPFCDRVSDAWDIYRYRYDLEERTCGLSGNALVKHMDDIKSSIARENKVKAAVNYMYVLVAQIDIDDKNNFVIGQDGVPSYRLKIMRLSESQVDKLQLAIKGAGEADLCGCELLFSYGNGGGGNDNNVAQMLAMKDRVITVRGEKVMATVKYPELVNRINTDVAKFDWDGIEKTFKEFQQTPAETRLALVNNMFSEWDKYKEKINAGDMSATYLEYNKVSNNQPQLGNQTVYAPKMPELGLGNAFGNEEQAPKINATLPQMGELGGNLDI